MRYDLAFFLCYCKSFLGADEKNDGEGNDFYSLLSISSHLNDLWVWKAHRSERTVQKRTVYFKIFALIGTHTWYLRGNNGKDWYDLNWTIGDELAIESSALPRFNSIALTLSKSGYEEHINHIKPTTYVTLPLPFRYSSSFLPLSLSHISILELEHHIVANEYTAE